MGLLPHPPGSPDQEATKWDPTAGILESTLLGTVHMWSLKYNKHELVGHIVRNFLADDIYQAMCVLSASVGGEKPTGHRNTADRTAGDLYASEVCEMLVSLSNAKKLPKIMVSSLSLTKVPAAVLTSGDEIGVGARLESLEMGMKKVTEALGKIAALIPKNAQPSVAAGGTVPAVVVTPAVPGPHAQVGQPAGQGALPPQMQVPSAAPATPQDLKSWADATSAALVKDIPPIHQKQAVREIASAGRRLLSCS